MQRFSRLVQDIDMPLACIIFFSILHCIFLHCQPIVSCPYDLGEQFPAPYVVGAFSFVNFFEDDLGLLSSRHLRWRPIIDFMNKIPSMMLKLETLILKVLWYFLFSGMDSPQLYWKIGWIQDSLGLRSLGLRSWTCATSSLMSSIAGLGT